MESGVQHFLPCTVVDLVYGWIMPSSGVRKGNVCYKPVFKVPIFYVLIILNRKQEKPHKPTIFFPVEYFSYWLEATSIQAYKHTSIQAFIFLMKSFSLNNNQEVQRSTQAYFQPLRRASASSFFCPLGQKRAFHTVCAYFRPFSVFRSNFVIFSSNLQ